jgi:hypothetical protein
MMRDVEQFVEPPTVVIWSDGARDAKSGKKTDRQTTAI